MGAGHGHGSPAELRRVRVKEVGPPNWAADRPGPSSVLRAGSGCGRGGEKGQREWVGGKEEYWPEREGKKGMTLMRDRGRALAALYANQERIKYALLANVITVEG